MIVLPLLREWMRSIFGPDFVEQEVAIDLGAALNRSNEPEPDLTVLRRPAVEIRYAKAIPALMEAFWKPELPAPYWADCKLRLSQLRAPSMHALVVDLAEALSPFLSPDIAPDLFRRRGVALC